MFTNGTVVLHSLPVVVVVILVMSKTGLGGSHMANMAYHDMKGNARAGSGEGQNSSGDWESNFYEVIKAYYTLRGLLLFLLSGFFWWEFKIPHITNNL